MCQRLLILFFVTAMALPNGGCASGLRLGSLGFGDAILEGYRDRVWAKRAYNLRYNNCDLPYESHFQNGFVAGYCDTCNGGDGYVPALPPDDYRGFEFQSPDGAQCVKSWFEGFPAGVAAAKKDRAGEFHDIYTSRMINSAITQKNAKHILPSDVPVKPAHTQAATQGAKSTTAPPVPTVVGTAGPANSSPFIEVPYAAPPATKESPLLTPRNLTPTDLVEAPTIRKSGPVPMAPISKMKQFTIDPSVKSAPSSIAPKAAAIEAADPTSNPQAKQLAESNQGRNTAGLPPIVSTTRSQIGLPPKPPTTVPAATVTQSQTPLPMAIRSASAGWRSQTSSRRR
jgi:hypothetical protein